MTSMSFKNLCNQYLKGIDLEIHDGEFFVLMGHSGSGKTTLLQTAAGLIPYQGHVLLDQKPVDSLPPYLRGMGYLFQDLLLFPHMTVKQNIEMGMGRPGQKTGQQNRKSQEMLALFQIDHLAERYPRNLSGGEKQRVALARAVGSNPDVLLLDEPFASLDHRTARYLRQEIKRLQAYLKLTVLFVTHSLDEAQELGNRIGILKQGRLDRVGSPEDIWTHRSGENENVSFHPNILACSNRKELGNGLVESTWAGLKILVPDDGTPFNRIMIHPAHVYISHLRPPGPPVNRFQALVKDVKKKDGIIDILLDVNGSPLTAEISYDDSETLRLNPGDTVHGILKLRALKGL